MRGFVAFLVIAVVFALASELEHPSKDSLFRECGIKAWSTAGNKKGKEHHWYYKNKSYLIEFIAASDPVGCQRLCQNSKPRKCRAFNFLPDFRGDYACELLTWPTPLKDSFVDTKFYNYSYTGGPRCKMVSPRSFLKSCYNFRKADGMIKLGERKIRTIGERMPLTCYVTCKTFWGKGKKCNITSFEFIGTWKYIKCHYYYLHHKLVDNQWLDDFCKKPTDYRNFWSGRSPRRSWVAGGTKRVRINL